MSKTYRIGIGTRVINSIFRHLTGMGMGSSYRHILTVPGRKTGKLYSTPVDVMQHGDSQWLVAGYGPANWVQNARVAREVTLSRSGRSERFAVEDVQPVEAVPVLRQYMREVRVTRRYFNANPDSPDDVIAAELSRHPVIRLSRVT